MNEKKTKTTTTKWHFVTFDGETRPHALPPSIAKTRIADVLERHKTSIVKVKKTDTVHLDAGGMIRLDSPTSSWTLRGSKLKFTCFKHQEFIIREAIEAGIKRSKTEPIVINKVRCVRFCVWPGTMVYMTVNDAIDVVAQMAMASKYAGELYKADMSAALVNANAAIEAAHVERTNEDSK